MQSSLTDSQLQQLEQEGFTVVPNFLDTGLTARVRAHMDSLLPPVASPEATGVRRLNALRHPIPGAIMAEILSPELVSINQQLLRSNDLRLLEQVLIRTDPQKIEKTGATGWHVDMAFLPEHYLSTPRQTYFHMVHALSAVPAGGGAFTVIPGSHHKTYAAAQKVGLDGLSELKRNPIEVAEIDVSTAIEVLPSEGDLLIFNPMALHSASTNIADVPRYVYFASFYDPSAEHLQNYLRSVSYQKGFPDSLRDNLPAKLRTLL